MDSRKLFEAWQPWQVALAGTVAAEMIRYALTPEEMLRLSREYVLSRVTRDAETAAATPGAEPNRRPEYSATTRTVPSRPAWQKEVERGVMLGGACPKCGGPLMIKRMCPHVSPRIRTQLACNSDACDWAAVSVHPWDYLARKGLEGNVEVQ